MLKSLISLGTLTATLFAGTAVAFATPAAASCPSGATCSYPGNNFTGTQGPVYGNNTNDKQYATWAGAESISNNGKECADWIYQNENYGGSSFVLDIGYVVSNLSGSWGW